MYIITFHKISGNVALARSYMSAATLETERNTAMSLLASMQALGFILGPGMYICVHVCIILLYMHTHTYIAETNNYICMYVCTLLVANELHVVA